LATVQDWADVDVAAGGERRVATSIRPEASVFRLRSSLPSSDECHDQVAGLYFEVGIVGLPLAAKGERHQRWRR
jgi:hypothetical protein